MTQLCALIIIPLLLLLFECSEWCRGRVLIHVTYSLDVNSKIPVFNWKNIQIINGKSPLIEHNKNIKFWNECSLLQSFRRVFLNVSDCVASWKKSEHDILCRGILQHRGERLKVKFRKFGTPRKSNVWREASCLYCWDVLLDKLSTNPVRRKK